ncbi:hypothetical protein Acaty_c1878 [Acidithiobacillus caldus ATCC 51756]|uniref:Uncharacterized protein n=1 Tax=Acidithiobacillus caldus (strain ATCC 51756 / DSM 8584 / KU) TaxID=637389 RepID=A0A060A0R3_ACICK|nr:hypothetical protein Acaty_c1878 [Acidithiobacillus caldus ATCC 51756]
MFWNDSLISEEEYMPFQTLEEAKTWVKRRLENRQGKSLGKA